MLRRALVWLPIGWLISASVYAETELAGYLGVGWGGATYIPTTSGEDVSAGGGVQGGLGLAYTFPLVPLQVQGTLGYKVNGNRAIDGDTEFHRTTADAILFYKHKNHRLGVGALWHFDPTYEWLIWDVDDKSDKDDAHWYFKDGQGFLVQYDYIVSSMFAVGLRYEHMKYEGEKICIDGECWAEPEDVDGDYLVDYQFDDEHHNPDAYFFGFQVTMLLGASDFSTTNDWKDW